METLQKLGKNKKLFLALILIFLLYKIIFIYLRGPLSYPDTPHYLQYAHNIISGNFVSPDALRTPGYPLFIDIATLGGLLNDTYVVIVQLILGLVTMYLLYIIFPKTRYREYSAAIVTFIYLNPLTFYENKLLSETFSFFLIALILYTLFAGKRTKLYIYYLLPLLIALLILTKVQYGAVMLIMGIYLIMNRHKKFGIIVLSSAIFTMGSYSYANYVYNNYFGMSSLISFALLNHTKYYIEEGRELNPELVDVYVNYRDKKIQTKQGLLESSLGITKDSICNKLNISYVVLLKELNRISIYVIFHRPFMYLESCIYTFINLFDFTKEYNHNKYLIPLSGLSYVSNIFFILGFIFFIYRIKFKDYFINSLMLIFFVNLIISILLDTSEISRHIMPTSFVIIIFFVEFMYRIKRFHFISKIT